MPPVAKFSGAPYVEARDDETKDTAVDVLRNAVAWFNQRGVTVERVMTDNGGCYRSHAWRDALRQPRYQAQAHPPHSAIGKAAPITRLNNLAGHHT